MSGSRATRTRLTIRTRLTLTYGALFAASAAAMVGLLYLFMQYGPSYSTDLTVGRPASPHAHVASAHPDGTASDAASGAAGASAARPSPDGAVRPGTAGASADAGVVPRPPGRSPSASPTGHGSGSAATGTGTGTGTGRTGLLSVSVASKADFLKALLLYGSVVFLALLSLSLVVGWFAAGRTLTPLKHITATARGIADSTLHERIALTGPKDEITELADTFNAMLRRLERAFQAQRRFAANASHELRTPLASMRTIVQVALASSDPADLRQAGAQLLVLNRRSTEITEALLTLARADHGAIVRQPVDLGEVTRDLCAQARAQALASGVAVTAPTGGARVLGDPTLLRQLAHNLIDNAVRHNRRAGSVTVTVAQAGDGGARLTVRNSGPKLDADEVDRAFEPFHRLDTRQEGGAGRPAGHGLGLAIVHSIVRAHGGTLSAVPLRPDGLEVSVVLPDTPPPPPGSP